MSRIYLGLDAGSVSVKAVFIDDSLNILEEHYVRHLGRPYQTIVTLLEKCFSENSEKYGKNGEKLAGISVTGSGNTELASACGAVFVNEIIAHSRAISKYHPEVKTVIEMGGEDSKLLVFDRDKNSSKNILKDFSMNALCAAGTGSFLDQQATRLGISIEKEFGEYALKSELPPRIAGRCSVFAKSDMIHLQQIATPDYDIVAGLCFALARNFKSSIGKGMDFIKPVAFQGGVAANAGMVRAFTEVLELQPGELIIPEHFKTMGAIGSVLYFIEENCTSTFSGLESIRKYNLRHKEESVQTLAPLHGALTPKSFPNNDPCPVDKTKITDVFLGIDIGSISTNLAIVDKQGNLLAKQYLMTASRPIEAVRQGLKTIGDEIGPYINVCGVGTTGSGRYLIGDYVGADIIANEITAQATASIHIDPKVDTIFEIGGQDSKYIYIQNGAIIEFEMNKACAAGTGSFLEEQAERLNISIKEEFSKLALSSDNPVPLGDRCTVFMESDLVHHQQAGAEKNDLLAGLAYSTVHNYINRVVGDKPIGNNIFFQGGTAFNKSVVAAFNRVCGTEVTVPPHHEVTGAIGVAIIAMQRHKGESAFKGFDVSNRKYTISTFECQDCSNLCEIRKVEVENEKPLYYGSRCEKFDVDHSKKISNDLPNLFSEREKLMLQPLKNKVENPKGKVGIPRTLIFMEHLPFWITFFKEIGFEVVLSDRTNTGIIHSGVEAVVAETCFPIKVAHGHIINLLEKNNLDMVFLPSIINSEIPKELETEKDVFNCPYIQTVTYMADSAIGFSKYKTKVFSPVIHMQYGRDTVISELNAHASFLKTNKRSIAAALDKAAAAQKEFKEKLLQRGKEILENLPQNSKTLVIIGRPYNTCDSGQNLDIPKKLLKMNVLPIPIEMLPVEENKMKDVWGNIYWKYGQRILKIADFLNKHPKLYPLYITNFSCGPDSFILKFFGKAINDRPFLQIEIDEHSADAGVITRCEAYLDTLDNNTGNHSHDFDPASKIGPILIVGNKNGKGVGKRKVFLPYMCEHAHAFEAAFQTCGVEAQVMEPSDELSLMYGRKYTTGKECYPALLTTGDIIREINRPGFDPDKSAFFMASASGPCRFGCYYLLQRFILDDLGYKNIPIALLDQDRDFEKAMETIDPNFDKYAYWGIIGIDALEKLLYETRPYEINKGETNALFRQGVGELKSCIKEKKTPNDLMKKYKKLFHAIPTDNKGSKPVIGIVGEIYVRLNTFANDSLIPAIEELGGEANIATFGEWINYITVVRSWKNKRLGQHLRVMKDKMRFAYQRYFEGKIAKDAGVEIDASVHELFDYAEDIIDKSFHGEAILSIGKTIEYIDHGNISGVINTMPFTCMPGTIVTAMTKKVKENHGDIPFITMAFAGQQGLNSRARLEAFVYQAKEYQNSRKEEKTSNK